MTRILGIDPGSRYTGFGVIDIEGNHATHVTNGCIRVKGETLADKLHQISSEIDNIINEHQPEEVSIEKVFMHKNADSALKLGQARGVAIAACANRGLSVFEYTANQVKQATVGKGHAKKDQVQHMVKILLCLQEDLQEDASDALAIALCHGHSRDTLMKIDGVRGVKGGRLV